MAVRRGWLVLGFVLACAACSTTVPRQHVVMFAADGSPIDPGDTGWFGPWLSGYGELLEPGDEDYGDEPDRHFEAYVDGLIEARLRVQLLLWPAGRTACGGPAT